MRDFLIKSSEQMIKIKNFQGIFALYVCINQSSKLFSYNRICTNSITYIIYLICVFLINFLKIIESWNKWENSNKSMKNEWLDSLISQYKVFDVLLIILFIDLIFSIFIWTKWFLMSDDEVSEIQSKPLIYLYYRK